MVRYGKTHGMYGTPTYRAWSRMLQRCNRPGYKAKGITVDPAWRGPNGFVQFLADMGERPEGLTLDRIDNSKDYTSENCRWATWREQGRNRDTTLWVICDDIRMTLPDAIEAKGLPARKVRSFMWYAMRFKGATAIDAFNAYNIPRPSWVEYQGVSMPLATACKLAGIAWRRNIIRKARIEEITLQSAFDHFLSKEHHPTRQLMPSQ